MQINLSVQTIKTLIWVIGSTSKGRGAGGERGNLQKCDYSIQGRVQIVKLLNPPCPLDVDPMTQIEVSIVCIERLVCMFVSTVSSCFEPRLLISLSDHSLSPFSRSPSGAWSPPGVPQFSDRCVGMAIRRFPPLLFLLPCGFHVFALLFG